MQEGIASIGQGYALSATLEQPAVQGVFQFSEGLGDGWLADRQGVSGTLDAALAGHFQEAVEVAQFDAVVRVHCAASLTCCRRNSRGGRPVWRLKKREK